MATKIIKVFFSLAFWSLLGTVLSQTEPTKLICSVRSVQNEGRVDCYTIKSEGELVVSADFLRQLNISDDKTKTTYLLSEYPHPIASFRIDIAAGIRIKEDALKALPKLTSLELQCFEGTVTIPSEELKNTPDLKSLSLRHCTIPANTLETIRSAPKLEYLELFHTKGGKLKSDSLRGRVKLNAVRIIYSGFNAIEDGTFDGLPELKKLALDGNNISSITSSLPKDSSKLEVFQFYDNAISTIPKRAFAKYKQLTTIFLRGNAITKLEPGVFEGLENLVNLYLNENPIHQLPEGDLQKMINLKTFSLDHSKISTINSTTFKGLRNLRYLSLDYCKALTTIEPGSFDDFVSMTAFDLQGNQRLRTLPDGLFKNMKSLQVVDFRKTCVQNLSRANFTHCPQLELALFDQEGCTASV